MIEHKHRLSAESRPHAVSRGALPGSPQTGCPEKSQARRQTLRESVDSRSTHISLGMYSGECYFGVPSDLRVTRLALRESHGNLVLIVPGHSRGDVVHDAQRVAGQVTCDITACGHMQSMSCLFFTRDVRRCLLTLRRSCGQRRYSQRHSGAVERPRLLDESSHRPRGKRRTSGYGVCRAN